MVVEPLDAPRIDPTPIFEQFRGSYGSELLTAAVAHFNVFGRVAKDRPTVAELRGALGLADRPMVVLLTTLRAMKLLALDVDDRLALTPMAEEHLVPGGRRDVSDYIGLAAGSPGVVEMVERLRSNRPAGADDEGVGTAFIYRDGVASAMEDQGLARHFTLALAGRAKNIAPILAERVPLNGATALLDVGGGTGIYSVALLRRKSSLRAVVLDRPEVLKTAREFAQRYGVADRLDCREGDMFADAPWPEADVVLLSNVLHDWDVPECRTLVRRAARAVRPGGQVWIHDVFLNDAHDGPLPIALYSAALFTLTEGRAYSQAEYRAWFEDAGLRPGTKIDTLIHCGVLPGHKPT